MTTVSICSMILVLVTVVMIAVNDVVAVDDIVVVVVDDAVVKAQSSKRNLRGVPGACFLRKGIPRRA